VKAKPTLFAVDIYRFDVIIVQTFVADAHARYDEVTFALARSLSDTTSPLPTGRSQAGGLGGSLSLPPTPPPGG